MRHRSRRCKIQGDAPAHAAAGRRCWRWGAWAGWYGAAGRAAMLRGRRRLRGPRRRPAAARGHAARRPRGDLPRPTARCWLPARPAGPSAPPRGSWPTTPVEPAARSVERDPGAGLRGYAGQILGPANLQRLPAAPPRGYRDDGRRRAGLVPGARCGGHPDPAGYPPRLPAGGFYGRSCWALPTWTTRACGGWSCVTIRRS